MTKIVLDVGNCSADHGSLREMLESNFEVKLIQAHSSEDAFELLRTNQVDLLLANRKFDLDGADGIELIRRVKSDPAFRETACMLISNFDEYQQQAVAAGAEPGFGKSQLGADAPKQALATLLG